MIHIRASPVQKLCSVLMAMVLCSIMYISIVDHQYTSASDLAKEKIFKYYNKEISRTLDGGHVGFNARTSNDKMGDFLENSRQLQQQEQQPLQQPPTQQPPTQKQQQQQSQKAPANKPNTVEKGGKILQPEVNSALEQNHNTSVNKESKWIITKHRNSSSLLRKDNYELKSTNQRGLCPLWSPNLVGQLHLSPDMNITAVSNLSSLAHVAIGGRYSPSGCEPREKTAVIIPYREREKHLKIQIQHLHTVLQRQELEYGIYVVEMIQIQHLHTVLQRQELEYGIYVVEMAYPSQFNRGLLANVGFLTAASIKGYSCFIIHDVDLLMADDRNLYRCGRVPRHLASANMKFNNGVPYASYFGGVSAFTSEQYWKVNGYSNLYFGWGGEDDDMVARIITSDLHFSRTTKAIGSYVALQHDKDLSNPPNPHRLALRASSGRRKDAEGVRTVKYNRLALEFKELYTWVYIGVREAHIMEKYQKYLHVPEEGAG